MMGPGIEGFKYIGAKGEEDGARWDYVHIVDFVVLGAHDNCTWGR